MRKNRKNNSRTWGNRICIAAFLLTCSLMLGGCGVKKEKEADSELPKIVIGMDYLNLTVIRQVMANIKVLMWNLLRKHFGGWDIGQSLRI